MSTPSPPLYELVDTAFSAADQALFGLPGKYPMAAAPILGAVGTFAVAKGVYSLAKNNDFIYNKVLPVFEKVCKYGPIMAFLAYGVIDPEGAKTIFQNHPVYTAGMLGSYAAGVVAVNQEEKKRENEKARIDSLEGRICEPE